MRFVVVCGSGRRAFIAAALAFAMLAGSSAPAALAWQPGSALEVTGVQAAGALGAVAHDGGVAWALQGRWLLSIDTSEAALAHRRGRLLLDGRPLAVAAGGGWVVAGSGEGAWVVDGREPDQPVLRARLDGAASGVAIEGDRAYLAGHSLRVVSLAESAAGEVLGEVAAAGGGVAVAGGRAYLANGEAGVAIWDVSDPAAMRQLATVDGRAAHVAAAGSLLLVGGPDHTVQLVDVADPANPALVATYAPEGRDQPTETLVVAGLVLRDSTAYVTYANCGGGFYCRGTPSVRAVDVSEPRAPAEIASVDLRAQPVGLTAGEGRVLVTMLPLWWYAGIAPCSLAAGGLEVLDAGLGVLGRMGVLVGASALEARAWGVAVAEPEREVAFVDASDPASPGLSGPIYAQVVGSRYGMGGPRDLAAIGSRLFVARGPASVVDPGFAGLNGCSPPPRDEWYIALAPGGDVLYALAADNGFQILGLNGRPVASLPGVRAAALAGFPGRAVAAGDAATWVIDARDASAPRVAGQIDVAASGVAMMDRSWAFLAAGDRGLVVLDLRDGTPAIAAEMATGEAATDVSASGGVAYVVAGGEVIAYDVSQPGAPRLLGAAELPGAQMVSSSTPLAYVLATGGLYVLTLTGAAPSLPVPVYVPYGSRG